ncbi:MAG TPA: hypothetical protein DCR93_21255 [Cytophagales bacterium]|nr:hypothetical protein [Cytophagales bacterium]HAP61916.1 hypothetical protein [Cytophagales bacterium]
MEALSLSAPHYLPVGGAHSYTSIQHLQVDPIGYAEELHGWLLAFPKAAWSSPGLQDIRVLASADRSRIQILMAWESQTDFTHFLEGAFWQEWERYQALLSASRVILHHQHHHQLFELIE